MLSRYVVSQVKHNGYFLAGLAIGLWVALATVPLDDEPTCVAPPPPVTEDYEPQREERPDHAAVAAGRAVQRPRYYSTELGMRAPLLAGMLAAAADARTAALNATQHSLPALKFFITADSQASSGLANVVGFTDSRPLLRPFHALKYLADNFLDEYDFFFLAGDTAYVNARRLKELVGRLSVSLHVYMGVAAGDSQYCSLESGILLSNSVLRAIHDSLDWCVRNSYSPHHHENLGRCVLHAAPDLSCTSYKQGETYISQRLSDPVQLTPSLADAVTAYPATPAQIYTLHAYVSRVLLSRARQESRALRRAVRRGIRSHPPGFRNGTWPGGLRSEPGLAPPPLESRFDHPRWTALNLTHALMPDELSAVRPLSRAHKRALDMVWDAARAWALRQFGAREAALVEGALRWEPAAALRYRLLVRLTGDKDSGQSVRLRQLEVVRPLGAARLAPVPYVTESARIVLLLPVLVQQQQQLDAAAAFLTRYELVCLQKDKNTHLYIVLVSSGPESGEAGSLRSLAAALASKHRSTADVLSAALGGADDTELQRTARAGRIALETALPRLSRDSLVLLADVSMEFNEDFLNRARMNSIPGVQWFLPSAFARYSTFGHARVVAPDGSRPQHHTGRFTPRHAVLAVYKQDYQQALSSWQASGGSASASAASVLAASWLRVLRAPEPGLVLQPAPQPCVHAQERDSCLSKMRAAGEFELLELGAKHALAKLELEVKAELE